MAKFMNSYRNQQRESNYDYEQEKSLGVISEQPQIPK
jgi:hypothetical protein